MKVILIHLNNWLIYSLELDGRTGHAEFNHIFSSLSLELFYHLIIVNLDSKLTFCVLS